jgi:hypothetical protein
MLRQRAALAEWAPGSTDGTPVRDHRQVEIVYPVPVSAKSGLQDQMRRLDRDSQTDEPKSLGNPVDMGIHGQRRPTQTKEEDTGRGLGADSRKPDQPSLGIG